MYDAKHFYDKLHICCDRRGISVTKMLQKLNLSTSYGTYWKKGRVPNADILIMVADFLDVTIDYLLTEKDVTQSPPLSDSDKTMLRLFNQLDEHEKDRCIGRLEAYIENKDS